MSVCSGQCSGVIERSDERSDVDCELAGDAGDVDGGVKG